MNNDEKEKLLGQIPQTLTYALPYAEKILTEVEKIKDPVKVAEYCFNYVRGLIEKL